VVAAFPAPPPTAMGSLPRLVLTGASGFLARYVMRALKTRYTLIAVDRHPGSDEQMPPGAEVEWHQVDLGDAEPTAALFRRIAAGGPVEAVIHLAAYYDFEGDDNPEYRRTNVDGLRQVLEGCRGLRSGSGPARFVLASSVAACRFPRPEGPVNEDTPPDGDHLYARTKALGEAMLDEYREAFPSTIVRFAAMFSDWCEYPPLYHFLGTWLSTRWNHRILGGRGASAIPFLHVRDAAIFLRTVLDRQDDLEPGEVLVASPDESVSHRQLFYGATHEYFDGATREPLLVPRPLCRPGMWIRDLVGRGLGERPFERPWMADYIDLELAVDASRTRRRLGWEPRPRLDILHRMPFLIENYRTDPVEWHRRNAQFLLLRRLHPNLRLYQLLQDHREAITRRFAELLSTEAARERMPHYLELSEEERRWNHRLILRNLLHSVRTRRKGLFMAYCRDLAERRAEQGFQAWEVAYALGVLHRACHDVLIDEARERGLDRELHDAVTKTIRFGIDQVEMVYEAVQGKSVDLPAAVSVAAAGRPTPAPPVPATRMDRTEVRDEG
jgi:nucleoside-diphosphate-sugar epimerase